uniref:Putative nuclease HARBI1 n=1 Tax=Photinus pyralis TaxID=7054 RepID=A0A1Y1MXP7_PHOPY
MCFNMNTCYSVYYQILECIQNNTFSLRYHEIDPLNQLLITLRFYACGSFYITLGDFIGIHKTTAGRIIKRVTQALLTIRGNYIKFPENEEEKRRVQERFFHVAQFPGVIGAIDCTHVKIQSPGGNNAEVFRNRKGFFSLNVQAISDSRYVIMDIVARWPGSCHDSHIFANSLIKRRFEAGEFGESVLLGDSGYPLLNYLMTPIGNPQTPAEERYNGAHISSRTVVERTFGIYKRRFPVLSLGLRCKVHFAQEIIVATAVLHNIAILHKDEIVPPPVDVNNLLEDMEPPQLVAGDRNINFVQQRYVNYFQQL